MGTMLSRPACIAALACALLSACGAGTTTRDVSGDCESHYDSVASAATWKDLQDEIKERAEWGPVASLRTQSSGHGIGAGDEEVVRVVDLLDRNGRRLVQVEVWRTSDRRWRAGVWKQCID